MAKIATTRDSDDNLLSHPIQTAIVINVISVTRLTFTNPLNFYGKCFQEATMLLALDRFVAGHTLDQFLVFGKFDKVGVHFIFLKDL